MQNATGKGRVFASEARHHAGGGGGLVHGVALKDGRAPLGDPEKREVSRARQLVAADPALDGAHAHAKGLGDSGCMGVAKVGQKDGQRG